MKNRYPHEFTGIIPGTNIHVDHFHSNTTKKPGKEVFFLTHYHSDHTKGLTNDWTEGEIYCTSITKKLLHLKYPVIPQSMVIELLPFTQPQIINLNTRDTVTVTALDANHCPGSAMFLFEGCFSGSSCILHTGDFRYHKKMNYFFDHFNDNFPILSSKKRKLLYNNNDIPNNNNKNKNRIEMLIFDATFLKNNTVSFPTRNESIDKLLKLLRENPQKDIYLLFFTIDHIDLISSISNTFNCKIYINPLSENYKEFNCLGLTKFLSQDTKERIKIVSYPEHFSKSDNKSIHDTFLFHSLFIRASAMWFLKKNVQKPLCDGVYHLFWSSHSSKNEITEFIGHIQPTQLLYGQKPAEKSAENEFEYDFPLSFRLPRFLN